MSARYYSNRWIPQEAIAILDREEGTILDVGGGASPFYRADHIVDCLPFDDSRLSQNAWGADKAAVAASWTDSDYTRLDLCAGERWPIDDKRFDLGLCSHCLEDLREPIQVVRELARCCKRTLIICPSRLFEQMRGVDHPRFCGMGHHHVDGDCRG